MGQVLKYTLIFCLLSITSLFQASGQDGVFADHIYKSTIKTVQFHRAGWDLTYPIIELNGIDQVELSFDDLGDQIHNYSYTLLHCDADWKPSRLAPEEYLEGFTESPIQDYSLSFNTTVNYVHYRLVLPNDQTTILFSGNYILKVFEDFDQSNLVLTKRFSVSEPLASIEGNAGRPTLNTYREDGHQLTFNVYLGSVKVSDPYSEIKVSIQQNNRWNMSINNLKPLFHRNNTLDYSYQEGNIFKAGNEYRYFDIKSMRYQSQAIQAIDYQAPNYHVFLHPDPVRYQGPYFFHEDLNCPFKIAEKIIKKHKDKKLSATIIDFHAEATSEKVVLGKYLNGQASLIFGTHTHVPTADEQILSQGTGYITDIGMVGAKESSLGIDLTNILIKFLTQIPKVHEIPESGICQVNGLFAKIDTQGKCIQIKRIYKETEIK